MNRIHGKFYYSLRLFIHKRRGVLRFAQILRSIVILGPFRWLIILYFQRFGKNKPLQIDNFPFFPSLNVNEVVNEINEFGYSRGPNLSEEYVHRIVEYCEKINRIRIENPHKGCEAIDKLSRNEKVLQIARKYLGAEPILWLTELRWTIPNSENRDILPPLHQQPILYDPCAFHYDSIDCRCLTVFIYLTDVDSDSGPHVIIEGTQHHSLKELTEAIISDTVAQRKYGTRIRTILGERGTVLFEETSMYHKVATCKKRRLLLKIDYTLRRNPPPERSTPEHSQKVNSMVS